MDDNRAIAGLPDALLYDHLVRNLDAAVIVTDQEFVTIAWSRGAEAMYGWTAAEVLGRYVGWVTRADVTEAQRVRMLDQVAETGSWRGELTVHTKDGKPLLIESLGVAIRESTGEVVGYLGIHRDVTGRHREEETLRAAHRLNELILESITDFLVAVDDEWRITFINAPALERFEGDRGEAIARADVVGRDIWDVFPELVGTMYYEQLHRSRRERRPALFDAYFEEAELWIEVRAFPFEGGMSIHSRDVSESRLAEQELERRAAQQAAIATLGLHALERHCLQELMTETATLVAGALHVEFAKVCELLPGGRELLIRAGVGWREDVVGYETEAAGRGSQVGYTLLLGEPVISEDLATEQRFDPSTTVREHHAVSAVTVLIPGREGAFGALGAVSARARTFSEQDVTFLQAAANILATAVERADADDRLRDARESERRRIARDLHDDALRALNYALAEAYRAQLGGEPLPGHSLERLVPALKRVGEGLRGAIYDLRLAAEQQRPFPELLEALVTMHETMATDCEVQLEQRHGVPAGPLGDRGTQVLRIVGEALTNARRHSGANVIHVGVWGSPAKLCAEVSDDGRGFDLEREPSIGHGSGLKSMRERAAIVRGALSVVSTPGTGTRVRLEVPLSEQEDPALDLVRVLVVEDHVAVREAIALGFAREPDFAVAAQAGTLAEARELLDEIDVAVVDLGLPDGYGGDLIKELRDVNPQAQALVLSASLDHGEMARAVDSGAAGALDKTAHLDEIVGAVRRLRTGETLLPLTEVIELLRFAGRQREREHEDRKAIARLTPREREVLQALAEGLNSQGIADRLHITVRTERNHIASILAKLGVHSQLQALVFALRYGIVEIR